MPKWKTIKWIFLHDVLYHSSLLTKNLSNMHIGLHPTLPLKLLDMGLAMAYGKPKFTPNPAKTLHNTY